MNNMNPTIANQLESALQADVSRWARFTQILQRDSLLELKRCIEILEASGFEYRIEFKTVVQETGKQPVFLEDGRMNETASLCAGMIARGVDFRVDVSAWIHVRSQKRP